jgi:hypothetical protein
MKLSEIKQIPVGKLKKNPLNDKLFKVESGKYFKGLLEDIKARGIMVPLVAKKDGILLAGHNRLKCAIELGLKTVPVQEVTGKITEAEEMEFVIKDNLLRRHLSPEERASLYRVIYKDFDERLLHVHDSTFGVSMDHLSSATGLNPKTVLSDVLRMRKAKQKEVNKAKIAIVVNEKAIDSYKRAVSKMLNIAMIENRETRCEMLRLTTLALERLSSLTEIGDAIEMKDKVKRLM